MFISRHILDYCIKYLLANRAPKTITTSSHEESKHFGFWLYLNDSSGKYVLRERDGHLLYQCTKFNPTEEEKDVIHIKCIKDNAKLFSTDPIYANLFYNGYELSGITPVKAYIFGVTKLYKLLKWYNLYLWKLSQKKHKKALSHYKDRFRLLEALIFLYEEEHDNFTVIVDDAIEINMLALRLINSNDLSATYFVREHLNPVLRSLESDQLIQIQDNNVKLLPKAWSELSKYIIEERRHTDNQKALKWQRILMFFLVLGSITTAFLTFIRPDVQNNLKVFISSFL